MDERKLQYDRCRVEKNRCEKIFSYCMAGILLIGIVELNDKRSANGFFNYSINSN